MAGARHITRFESVDGLTVATLPANLGEYESVQELRNALADAVGMDYAVDLHGTGKAPLAIGQERMRALLTAASDTALDTAADGLAAAIYAIGRGKLWRTAADGSEQWCWARAAAIPRPVVTYQSRVSGAFICEFRRLSDWYAETETIETFALTGSPQTIAITNAGNTDARAVTFLLEADAASGFAAPSIAHPLTGESWSSSRTANNGNHALRVNTGTYRVERTTDNGANWSDDYAAFSTGAVQVGFMRLLPGAQSLTVTGCPDSTLTISFYAPFR